MDCCWFRGVWTVGCVVKPFVVWLVSAQVADGWALGCAWFWWGSHLLCLQLVKF